MGPSKRLPRHLSLAELLLKAGMEAERGDAAAVAHVAEEIQSRFRVTVRVPRITLERFAACRDGALTCVRCGATPRPRELASVAAVRASLCERCAELPEGAPALSGATVAARAPGATA